MADIKQKYGSNNQTITITLASLANNSARQSTEVSNSSDLFVDVLVQLKLRTGASGTSSTGYVQVFTFGTADGGTTRTENAGASDAAITLTNPTHAIPLGAVHCVANSTTYVGGPWSVAKAFGGVVPDKWGIIVVNKTGGTLDGTGGNFAAFYQGVLLQSV